MKAIFVYGISELQLHIQNTILPFLKMQKFIRIKLFKNRMFGSPSVIQLSGIA